MYSIFDSKLIDLLPPNFKTDPDINAAAEAVDNEFWKSVSLGKACIILPRVDELSEEVLDLLAWELHVDFYDQTLPIETKREIIKNSDKWHRRKGTPSAVEELISTLFGEGLVEEWFEYGGEPYKFRVLTNNEEVTNKKAVEFTRALNSVKNERSWLDKVVITFKEEMSLYVAGVTHIGEKLTLRQVI